jgi:hypothetical protein
LLDTWDDLTDPGSDARPHVKEQVTQARQRVNDVLHAIGDAAGDRWRDVNLAARGLVVLMERGIVACHPSPLGEVVGRREKQGRDLVALDHGRQAVADVDEQDPGEDLHAVVLDELAVLCDGGGVSALVILGDQLDLPSGDLEARCSSPSCMPSSLNGARKPMRIGSAAPAGVTAASRRSAAAARAMPGRADR